MTPTRLIAAATLASCGFFLASPAMSAVRAPDAPAVVDAAGIDVMPAQYLKRDKDRSRNRDQDRRDYRERDRDHYRWDYDRKERWRTDRHPRFTYWKGRHLPPQGRYLVITNYWDYGLRRPPRGSYYVRDDHDVFLVLEATRLIVDSFILLELLGR